MIDGQYEQLPDGDYVTIDQIEIHSARRPPRVVVNAEWADGRCSLTCADDGSLLTVQPGYVWDGVSGPDLNLNARETMEATLFHDALCEAMRGLVIPPDTGQIPTSIRDRIVQDWDAARTWVDKCFKDILRRDGARGQNKISLGLRLSGGGYAWPGTWPPATRLIPWRY